MMDESEDVVEDLLTEYAIRLSIQESNAAKPRMSSFSDSFVPPSEENRKIVTAIKEGQIFGLQDLVKWKYALDEADERGWFPLHEAAAQPIQQILEIILDASYKTMWEYKTSDGETPLTLAAKAGFVENVRALLEKGVWPNTTNDKGETPLLIAVRSGSFEMVSTLIKHNCRIHQPCVKRWSAMHEAAKQGRKDIVSLLLKNGGNVNLKDGYGVTPLGVAAEYGHCDVLEHLIHKGGDVQALADDGSSILFEAAGGGNPDCIALLLEYGGSGNVPNKAGLLPIHKAAYEGHYLVLKYLIPVTSQTAIQKSGISPVHSAADGQNSQCLELLIESDFDVNTVLDDHISNSYDDERKTALYFAVSNNDILCTEILLKAGANPNKDPLNCLLVAVRGGNHEIFCDFIAVPWLKHLAGKVVRIFIDYMDYVPLCTKIKFVLETQKEWTEIRQILDNPRPLKHLCRLKIRKLMGLWRLQKLSSMKKFPLPPVLKNYILYKEYDLYGKEIHLE
ncbi:ankyrin repeat and SOCS box protein 15 isoform X4 [Meleagris gallopavo]|uniref:ankyrin repeat and SOCS box protein 15 isoform X4 n=1 Tax=Meleagris gallopavo TaxID=9103 RepID=UPI000549BDAD|nr:ankyrin repeat and SOCS box protein 15 isoform X4 [Meleagris gallopavo]